MNEKEKVYAELDALRRKSAAQRREINELRRTTGAKENAVLRREAVEYRKALSNILHRLDTGGVSEDDLRHIVQVALVLRGLKGNYRRQAEKRRHGL